MLLTIHDSQMRKVAFLDNTKQGTLNYTNDKWHRVLETASSTFEFTVPKKDLEADSAFNKVYSHLNEKAYVSFKYRGRNFVFVVAKVEESYLAIKCTCLNLNLDMINSEVGPYKAKSAMSFAQYCKALGLTTYKGFSIGINEISNKRLTLEWEGTDTKVKRLLSLANKFQAEIEFDVQFHDDSSIKAFVINVFKEGDGENNHGVGRIRKDKILRRGKDIKIIERTIDKTGIYNALILKGKEEVRINDNSWKVLNDKGEVEFYQKGDTLYAPLSLQMYPSAFEDENTGEQWSKKIFEVDSDDLKKIRETGYRELKKLAYPAVTYTAKGGTDLDLGDTIRLQDSGFIPALTLEARVIEQTISFTKPSQNESIYGNFKALENRVSKDLMARLEEMVEAARPYTIKLEIEGGVIFKNHIGQTRVEATLYKGGKVVHDVNWSWSFGNATSNSQDYLVEGSMVTDTKNLIVTALSQGREVAREQLTFSNVFDGAIGKPGLAGADGRTPFIHTAWADSADGSQGFNTTVSTGKAYFGTCTTYSDTNPTGADPTDYRRYNWSKIKGDAGRGIVNTTHYFLATAQGSGVTASTSGWTTTAQYTSESKKYLWNYTVTEYSDNTSQTSIPIIIGVHGAKGDKGDDGIPGRDGVGIRLTTVTYGISSSDTVQPTSWSNNVPTLVKGQYLWTKTVWTYTDNHTETGYQKTYISRDGNNGRDGIPGKDGVGIRSTAINYAVSTSGTSAPTVGWGEQVPDVPSGQYLWTRTIYTYTDNDTETAYSVSKMGEKGADGRSPYIHWAYSDNADGTGLTASDNGQRYIGHYSDYTQADSTDKTKYRWADRWANIKTGASNLLDGTRDLTGNVYPSQNTQDLYNGFRITKSKPSSGYSDTFRGLLNVIPDQTSYTVSFYAKASLPNYTIQCFFWSPNTTLTSESSTGDKRTGGDGVSNVIIGTEWRRYSVTWTQTPASSAKSIIIGRNHFKSVTETAEVQVCGVALYEGTIAKDWSPSVNDLQSQIDSKANQEEINALNERMREEAEQQAYELTKLQEQAQSIRVELEAQALASEIKQWLAEYKEFAQSTDKTIEDFTRSFFKSQERIVEMEKALGENALMLSFVNNYLRASEDGVTLGNKDNTEYIQITPQGIQLMSAGVSVATIANGLMKTAHGVLTDSLQVGKFRFEQSKRNPDINVWRYVE
ncbi:TPA: hypothetical protein U1343_000248 [Streptococcus suis]|nr:hypothetical protein [Streptococcus suis]HEM5235373.1 hypothetical protein [Streptococcus suis]HEM5241430.1 hypothetical protein [Streptococcus suis]